MPTQSLDPNEVYKAAVEATKKLHRPASAQDIADHIGINKVSMKKWSRQAVLAALNRTPEGREHVEVYIKTRKRKLHTVPVCTGNQVNLQIMRWLESQGIFGEAITLKELTPDRLDGEVLFTTCVEPHMMVIAKTLVVIEIDGMTYDRSVDKRLENAQLVGYYIRGTPSWTTTSY
jgi:hypothetical protein